MRIDYPDNWTNGELIQKLRQMADSLEASGDTDKTIDQIRKAASAGISVAICLSGNAEGNEIGLNRVPNRIDIQLADRNKPRNVRLASPPASQNYGKLRNVPFLLGKRADTFSLPTANGQISFAKVPRGR